MNPKTLEYRVEDRSILLPYYKRLFVDPLLPFIPTRVSPNAITHAGHVANLAAVLLLLGAGTSRGWPYVFAAVLLHVQVWCDNADGGHARRTGQCSPLGEFLDHGLDVLNVVYIGLLTCAALGVTSGWWVALTLIVPSAVSVTYWEQAVTGMFRLGLLNQVESAVVLAGVLLTASVVGTGFFAETTVAGVSLRLGLCVWVFAQIAVGMLRSLLRVARVAPGDLVAVVPLFAFDLAIGVAVCAGTLDAGSAVATGIAMNVFLGVRMLLRRVRHERPHPEALLVLGAVLFVASAVLPWLGVALHGWVVKILTVLLCGAFGICAVFDVREGLRRVQGMTAVVDTIGHETLATVPARSGAPGRA
jgi:phosphatidylglycerophosphate synthase